MELKETVDMMLSADYKERFKAEYYQTKARLDKLAEMMANYEAGTLSFTPTCPAELLKAQLSHMFSYVRCLEHRAAIEGIKL